MSYRIISNDGRCDLYINGEYRCSSSNWIEVATKFENMKGK